MSVWLQICSHSGNPEGSGWGVRESIWSPSEARSGSMRQYRVMLSVRPGDLVINCQRGQVLGFSDVKQACQTLSDRPPNPGPWGYARSFLRIPLHKFHALHEPISMSSLVTDFGKEIAADIQANRPKYYLFSWHPVSEFNPVGKLVLAQGRFLAQSTPVLTECCRRMFAPADRHEFDARLLQAGI
jgi:hypothetical protein